VGAIARLEEAETLAPSAALRDRIFSLLVARARRLIEQESWGAAAIQLQKASSIRAGDPEVAALWPHALGEGHLTVHAPVPGVITERHVDENLEWVRDPVTGAFAAVKHGRLPLQRLVLSEGYHYLVLATDGGDTIHLPVFVRRGREERMAIPVKGLPPGYVYVHGGPFLFGGDDTLCADGTVGRREMTLPGFLIQRTPVMLSDYLGFFTNEVYASVMGDVLRESGLQPADLDDRARELTDLKPHRWDEPVRPGEPVRGISYYEALAYARWVGGRLPSEYEVEKATRGIDGRLFVSGNREPRWITHAKRYDFVLGPLDEEPATPYGAYGFTQLVGLWTTTKAEEGSRRASSWTWWTSASWPPRGKALRHRSPRLAVSPPRPGIN
jgi:formylglycine-generating enzyme required for sulfatase activity